MNPWGSRKERKIRARAIKREIESLEDAIRKLEEPWKLEQTKAKAAGGDFKQNLTAAYFGPNAEQYRNARSQIEWNRNAIESLKEDSLKFSAKQAGLEIPEKYIQNPNGDYRRLTEEGKIWVGKEVDRLRMEWIKERAAVYVPVAALVVAIVGLLLKVFMK